MKANVARVLVLMLGGLWMAGPAVAASPACDRACMTGLISQYVDALVAHDPARLPGSDSIRFTEDSRATKLGEGLWKTVTGKTDFRHDYIDLRRQVAATHVVLREGDVNVLLSAILHVTDRRISGIETLVQRVDSTSRFRPTELGKPIRGMDDAVPKGKLQSRDSMVRTALLYPEGLRIGSFIDAGTPFATETYRVENGVITAGQGCGRADCGMYAQSIMVHPGIIASVAAVDEEKGTVLLWMNFGHTGNSYGEGNSLITFEAFKVWGGEIHAISAFFKGMPIATTRFWPSADKVYR